MTEQAPAPVVRHVDARHRYEILLAGERVGLTAYRDRDRQRVFVHTEVDAAHSGQGLAGILVRAALTDVRASGRRIVAVCPYVARYLKRHGEFADITDPVTPAVFQWLNGVLGR